MARGFIPLTCEHDGDAGRLRNGRARCPMCRRREWLAEQRAARLAEQAAAAAAREAAFTASRLELS